MWMNNMAMHHPTATPDDGDDDSWEVKAFQEDTSNILGATWPPRSYACSFCMREFRSAQALGGHMNVHRRDRARLHHQPPPSLGGSSNNPLPLSSPNHIIPTHQDLISNSGVCFLYSLPSSHGLAPTSLVNNYPSCMNNSHVYSPFSSNDLLPNCQASAVNYSAFRNGNHLQENHDVQKDSVDGEIDLELRLGYKSSASSSSSSYTP